MRRATSKRKKRRGPDQRRKLTPPEVALEWGLDVSKVIAWIRTGELRAMNAARNVNGSKPRFLIDREALAEFERARSTGPVAKPVRARRSTGAVTEYF